MLTKTAKEVKNILSVTRRSRRDVGDSLTHVFLRKFTDVTMASEKRFACLTGFKFTSAVSYDVFCNDTRKKLSGDKSYKSKEVK